MDQEIGINSQRVMYFNFIHLHTFKISKGDAITPLILAIYQHLVVSHH